MILVNNKFVVYIFLVDLQRIWYTESKNYIGFAQSGQVFLAMATCCFLHFCLHVRMRGAF